MPNPASLLLKLTALLALLMPILPAQNTPVVVRASHNEAKFWVDGKPFTGSQTFSWPIKSKHVLEMREPVQHLTGWRDTRLAYQRWVDPSDSTIIYSSETVLTIEADPKIPEYLAQFEVEYKLELWINDTKIPYGVDEMNRKIVDNADDPLRPSAYGLIRVEGVPVWTGGCVLNSRYAWIRTGTTITLNAIAYPGYGFAGWRQASEVDPRFPFIKLIITEPRTIRAYFAMARRHTFETAPAIGLQVIVDGAPLDTRQESGACLPPGVTPTPAQELTLPEYDGGDFAFCPDIPPLCTGERDLLPETEHLLAVPEIQKDSKGIRWVFDHWEWGTGEKAGQNFKYTPTKEPDPRTMTAHFVRGADATVLTVPNGLKVAIDGRSDWPAYNFVWGVGQKHLLAAPAEQTDAQGRRWVFKSWSNGGTATQEVAADNGHLDYGLVLRANYELLGQVTITSDNATPLFIIGDRECRAPCTVDMPAGSEAVVKVQPEEVFGEDIKVKFLSWMDGDTSTQRTVRFSDATTVLAAKFAVLNRLRLISDPEDSVDFGLAPEPMEGLWFPNGSEITLTAEPRRGYRFRRWDGALAGTVPSGWIRMSSPLTVVARMDKIPALKEGAVRNAADLLPSEFVAPGSLIAIDGLNLAAYFEKSPNFPLKQSIQGVYVTAGEMILPLISVAPETIVALLPTGMKLGESVLTVKTPNEPDMTADILVARNAPGIFWKAEGDLMYAEAYHADGKPVTPKDPARRGETVRILGTGFGPLTPLPPDGFPIPADPAYRLNDPVQIRLEDRPFPVESVTGAPGMHGMVWLRVKITDGMPAGMLARMSVVVNGVESSLSALPMQ